MATQQYPIAGLQPDTKRLVLFASSTLMAVWLRAISNWASSSLNSPAWFNRRSSIWACAFAWGSGITLSRIFITGPARISKILMVILPRILPLLPPGLRPAGVVGLYPPKPLRRTPIECLGNVPVDDLRRLAEAS